ncbi:hypothetical protein WT10_11610 [Burkholderia stagnalis]|nr:hypothetical protein WS59_21765 [Burkholderia stagnalis]KVN21977.1 hypothetical protein WT10_11610 [Burkholderia stagnalis]KWI65458.1 hypothetical protein WT75_28930 [Burkholderia stagnalis]KWK63151.1 hypothetical protein WT82_03020 [Burkholderia stagnalis]KWN25052.1 hypothetical protein WT84_06860 [Burkholderia stagnalis]
MLQAHRCISLLLLTASTYRGIRISPYVEQFVLLPILLNDFGKQLRESGIRSRVTLWSPRR